MCVPRPSSDPLSGVGLVPQSPSSPPSTPFDPPGERRQLLTMDGMEFFFEESVEGLVPRLDGGVVLTDAVAGAQLGDGGPCETDDAQRNLISSLLVRGTACRIACGGGEGADERSLTGVDCGSFDPAGEGIGDSCEMGDARASCDAVDQDADEEGVVVCNTNGSCWTRRVRVGNAPDERERTASRMAALEASVRAYVEKKSGNVVNPSIGTSFDSVEEGYEFYKLYSWEVGFGVRYAKSRLNVNRRKCMQEIVCACAGKPLKSNSRSTRCGCNAMIRLLRSNDGGWYVCEHRSEHNHDLSVKCGEKLHWKSHRHIDSYTRDLVKQLRENNISISKVYSVVGSFFGTIKDVPFTKRSLKTLCGKLNREQSLHYATKTIDVFNEMRGEDPEFSILLYSIRVARHMDRWILLMGRLKFNGLCYRSIWLHMDRWICQSNGLHCRDSLRQFSCAARLPLSHVVVLSRMCTMILLAFFLASHYPENSSRLR